eukprot:TRINITY_DN39182_c0_g1_i1.p2 TRINITY_DN39182_c0_g1~~TRINITY_DN39182_c0_g1_i1.p2  ORF type:complete len:152 (+),score=34.78 TRINITY_DN39182_c0_g1_i1:481-936(+)
MAPELFSTPLSPYSYEIDVYSFGILLFEITTGMPPYGYQTEKIDIIPRIVKGINKEILNSVENHNLKNLIEATLNLDPQQRPSFEQLKKFDFFSTFDWQIIEELKINGEITYKADQFNMSLYLEDIELLGKFKPKEVQSDELQKFDEFFDF